MGAAILAVDDGPYIAELFRQGFRLRPCHLSDCDHCTLAMLAAGLGFEVAYEPPPHPY